MSTFERIWPARGGEVTDGSFEYWSGNDLDYWTKSGSGSLYKSTSHKDGSYSARLGSSATGQKEEIYQDIADPSSYAGYRMTFMAWVKASEVGAYIYISTADGVVVASPSHPGDGNWHRLRVMADISASPARLRVGAMWDPASPEIYAYFDAAALVMGDTHGTINLESFTYPVGRPVTILADGETTADGVEFFDNALVRIIRPLRFDGMSEEFFRKLQNFINYVTEGPVYDFEFTDHNGEVFIARFTPDSLSDAELLGPNNIYRGTVTLKIIDRGLS